MNWPELLPFYANLKSVIGVGYLLRASLVEPCGLTLLNRLVQAQIINTALSGKQPGKIYWV